MIYGGKYGREAYGGRLSEAAAIVVQIVGAGKNILLTVLEKIGLRTTEGNTKLSTTHERMTLKTNRDSVQLSTKNITKNVLDSK